MKTVITVMLFSLLIAARTSQPANQAEVNQVQGILIFTDSKPAAEIYNRYLFKRTGII